MVSMCIVRHNFTFKMAFFLLMLMSTILCGHASESQIIRPSPTGQNVGRGPSFSGKCDKDKYIPIDNRFSASYNQYEQTNCEEIQSSCRCVKNNVADRLGLERLNDYNRDGVIEGAEFARTLRMADYNMDGCVSPDETADHDMPWFGWSAELLYDYAVSLATENCDGYSIPATLQQPPITMDQQMINLLIYTVNWCEADLDRYQKNCDCAQLPDACVKSRFRNLPECRSYTNRIRGREGCVFSSLKNKGDDDFTRDLPSESRDRSRDQNSRSADSTSDQTFEISDGIGGKSSHGPPDQGHKHSVDDYNDSNRRVPPRRHEIAERMPPRDGMGTGQIIVFQNFASGSNPLENRRDGGILDILFGRQRPN